MRIPILPDNDRYWLSVGGTYQLTPKISFDAAYSHIFVKDTSINITATSGNPWFDGTAYVGSVDSHIDIISVAMHYRWDEPAAPAPVKKGYFKANRNAPIAGVKRPAETPAFFVLGRTLIRNPLIPAQAGIQFFGRKRRHCGPGSPLSRGRADELFF